MEGSYVGREWGGVLLVCFLICECKSKRARVQERQESFFFKKGEQQSISNT